MTNDLVKKYPWLSVTTTLEKYIDPDYYDKILKKYIFNGKHDLDFLKDVATQIPGGSKIVEFGPGTGRATVIALSAIKEIKLFTLVELSDRMLARCKEKFADKSFVKYVNSDTINFLLSTNEIYNFAFSLWSFSHSIHQNFKKLGLEEGSKKVRQAITKLLTKNLRQGGSFFLVHFDSLSPEQKISINQRRKDNFVFANNKLQSPSKLLIDELLGALKNQGAIDFVCTHYDGAPLEFKSVDEALEYYLNFHMESHFNESKSIAEILAELSDDIEKHKNNDGMIRITPRCFIYNILKR